MNEGRPAESSKVSLAAIVLLLLLTLWLPLPFASVTASGRLILEGAAFLALAMAAVARMPGTVLQKARLPLLLLALLFLLGILQLVPLPSAWLHAVSPMSGQIQREASQVLALHGQSAVLASVISIAPRETQQALLLLAAYVALFCASALANGGRAQRQAFAAAILAAALFQLIYGTIAWTTQSNTIFGTPIESGPALRVRGSFVNPDHLAGYLEIALGVAFALLYREILTGSSRTAVTAQDLTSRIEARFFPLVLRVLLWLSLFGGILLTQSRAGTLSAVGATALVLALAYTRRRGGRIVLPALLAAALAFAIAFSAAPLLDRVFSTDPRSLSSDTRAKVWAAAARVQRRFPVFGTGLGTFRDAFPLEQPRELEELYDHAHNDFVEWKTTGGWIGFLLGLGALSTAFFALGRAWWKQPHRIEGAYALGGLGALAALSLHSFFDFNFAIPANAATLALVLGWSLAAASAKA